MTEAAVSATPALVDLIEELLTEKRAEGIAPKATARAVVAMLHDLGHYLPGCPPASRIRKDAEAFAGKLILSNLTVRLQRMANSPIVTPETKGLKRWLDDYIDGQNHGPLGSPMLWPQNLPGLAQQLRQWGFAPTPTRPPYVARYVPGETVQ